MKTVKFNTRKHHKAWKYGFVFLGVWVSWYPMLHIQLHRCVASDNVNSYYSR